MAFTGSPTIKQISDRMVRLTGLSLQAGQVGSITLSGAAAQPLQVLGAAATFGVLATQYDNAIAGTTINGDLGYVVAPVEDPTVTGSTHVDDATYVAAQAAAVATLAALQALPTTFAFAAGNVSLSADTTHGAAGVYTPGVYVVTGNATTGTISLSGAGTYVFRISGTLTVAALAQIRCINGCVPNDVWWLVAGDVTINAGGAFSGTLITSTFTADITVGAGTAVAGRLIAIDDQGIGGTVTTTTDTITAPATPGTPVALPAAFRPSPYVYGTQLVPLVDGVECTTQNAGSTVTQAPISVVKQGTTSEDFAVTLTNNGVVNSPVQEIWIRFHE